MMHRDLKSPNVLLSEEGVAKIADVGMVRPQVQDLVTAQPIMTPLWAAPEVTPSAVNSTLPLEIAHLRLISQLSLFASCCTQTYTACILVDPELNLHPCLLHSSAGMKISFCISCCHAQIVKALWLCRWYGMRGPV